MPGFGAEAAGVQISNSAAFGDGKFLHTSNESCVVPEGHPRTDRRFNAGTRTEKPLSPEGTVEDRLLSTVPSGRTTSYGVPGLKTPGYFRWQTNGYRDTTGYNYQQSIPLRRVSAEGGAVKVEGSRARGRVASD
jgi:hypothetical protein